MAARCAKCGENPPMDAGGVQHVLCQECHEQLWGKCRAEAGIAINGVPQSKTCPTCGHLVVVDRDATWKCLNCGFSGVNA